MSNQNLLLVAEAINSLTYLDLKSLIIGVTDEHENIFTNEDDIHLANAVAEWASNYIEDNQDEIPATEEQRFDSVTETPARDRY